MKELMVPVVVAREQYSYTRIQLRITFPSFVGTCKYLRWRDISIVIECFATSATDMISIVQVYGRSQAIRPFRKQIT
jgi:hypothetical protein